MSSGWTWTRWSRPRTIYASVVGDAGAAVFARGEGIWYGNEEVYFACTNGGIGRKGQIFRYIPSPFEATEKEEAQPGRLQLYLEPNNTKLLNRCDNVTVAPWGDLIICEDEALVKHLRGVTRRGEIYTLGRNRYTSDMEICGACFGPGEPTTALSQYSGSWLHPGDHRAVENEAILAPEG